MADHEIVASGAESSSFISPAVDAEYDNSDWIKWTRPTSQEIITPDTQFIVKFARPVDMDEISLSNFEIYEVIGESPLELSQVEDPFEELDTEYGYNSISRELVLTLNSDLDSLVTYFFIIKNLQDTTGLTQLDDHIVFFASSSSGTEYSVDTEPDIDTIQAEDYSLTTPDSYGFISTGVECSIADGTINVASDSFTLTFEQLEDMSSVTVTEENLDTGLSSVLVITIAQDTETFVATVTLPQVAQENCLYTVSAIYKTFQFIGTLDPFLVPLGEFSVYTSQATLDPITWARLVFMFSKEVEALLGSTDYTDAVTNNAEALKNYTKYLILSMFFSQSSNESFMLGELQVTTGSKTGGGLHSTIDFLSLLAQWERELFRYPIKSADAMFPRANEYNHVTGKRQQVYQRQFGTFDKRFF